MANVLVKQLIEAGVHFGHRASRWNPKMRPYIYGRRNLIHIIDVRETIRGLIRARKYLTQVASGGSLVLFVGTKKQAAETVEREAERCGMPYVSDRWLGGTLTNFRTIRSRLSRLEELEKQLIGTSSLTTGGLRTRRIFLLFMGAGKQGRMRRENEGNWRRLKGSGGSILFGKHLLEPGRMPAIDIECYHQ